MGLALALDLRLCLGGGCCWDRSWGCWGGGCCWEEMNVAGSNSRQREGKAGEGGGMLTKVNRRE